MCDEVGPGEYDIETPSCPLHLTIDTPWGPDRFTMPFLVLPGGSDVVIIGQKTMRKNLGIDLMAQFKALCAEGNWASRFGGMELIARSVSPPIDGAVLRAAMAVTAFVLSSDAPGDVDDEVALALPSQRPMIFQVSEVEMRDRVGVLETTVDNAVDHASPPKCAKMLRDIVFCTHLDVLCRALSGDTPARNKPMAVRVISGARAVPAKPPPKRNRLWKSAARSFPDCRSVVTTSLS